MGGWMNVADWMKQGCKVVVRYLELHVVMMTDGD